MLDFLTHDEMLAVLAQPGSPGPRSAITFCSHSFTTPVRGSRRSSVFALQMSSSMEVPALHLHGKGRKQRCGAVVEDNR